MSRPYSVRQYMVFVTYIQYKTILRQRFWPRANNKGTMRTTGDAFASFRLWTAQLVAAVFLCPTDILDFQRTLVNVAIQLF